MGHRLDNELATPGFAVGLTTDCTTGPVLIFSGNLQVLIFECSKFRISERTSDGGNGNHSVLLPIILIKFKVNQMIPSSYISSLMVSIL